MFLFSLEVLVQFFDVCLLMWLEVRIHMCSLFESIIFQVASLMENLKLHGHQGVVQIRYLTVSVSQALLLLLESVNINWVFICFIIRVLLIDTLSNWTIVNFCINQQTKDWRARIINKMLNCGHISLHIIDLISFVINLIKLVDITHVEFLVLNFRENTKSNSKDVFLSQVYSFEKLFFHGQHCFIENCRD